MSSSNFIIPSSPPESPPRSPAAPLPPATPDTRPHHAPAFPALGGMPSLPSTTPAGHPPAPVPFALAGAPAESFLSRATASSGSKPFGFAAQSQSSPGRRVLPANPSAPTPLGRSIRGARQPSTLSRQLSAEGDDSDDDDDDDEARGRGDGDGDDDASGEDEPPRPGDLFRRSSRLGTQAQGIDAAMDQLLQSEVDRMLQSSDGESGSEDTSHNESDDAEMFLSMRHDDRPYGQPVIGDESNLMFMTPAATDRVRKEAEDIYRRSTRFGASVHRPQFSSIARDFYTQNEPARLTEAPALVLATEDLVCRLYDEGVGAEDDAEKMDNSLANIACRLVELWDNYAEVLPPPEGEDFVTIGPGSQAEPFANAAYVANLMLRMHHTRFDAESQAEKYTPLPEVLLDWLRASHNMYPDLVREVSRHKPSPACHAHYWQVLRSALLRGDVESALQLLKSAGWEHARQGPLGDAAYTGAALDSTRQFVGYTCDMLEKCPGIKDDWDIWNSSWTMFRMEAKASLDRLAIFTEGRQVQPGGFAPPAAQSLSAMSRQASSKIPWSVYENLQVVYGIVLGEERSILDTAQDWCEATVGLFAWGDDGQRRKARVSLGASALRLSGVGDYFERLAAAFHQVLGSDMGPNILSPVEVAVACAFEGDVNAVIGCLRVWSLPVATSVAEIASLGKWLPLTPTTEPLPTDTLTMDDLNMLGVQPPSIDDVEGIKDTTMVLYARELAGVEHMSERRDGWEIAIQVLGRMDQPQKSEETVGELLRDLLKTLDEDSSQTVDKMWRILNDLGMVTFAEETAETFADLLSEECRRYGEALWYYALSHRAGRVREVLNLLMSYSLALSTAYPLEKDLDSDLRDLLRNRSAALERRAQQDIEAAQLLGRMLSGYATLRKFYELRDAAGPETSPSKAVALRKQAAFALSAVISSADDSIRGGLYDESREAVVSEDFLLALLGEATVFVRQSPVIISLEQMDILLKAVEDMETVGPRVYETCAGFLDTVLSAGQGLEGSTPADLMSKSAATLGGSSYVMSGSSMLASQVHKLIAGADVRRGWDWRRGWLASTKGEDVLRRLRLGLARDLAGLWLAEADGVAVYN